MLHEEHPDFITFCIATPPARFVSMSVLSKSNSIAFTALPSIAEAHCPFYVYTKILVVVQLRKCCRVNCMIGVVVVINVQYLLVSPSRGRQ